MRNIVSRWSPPAVQAEVVNGIWQDRCSSQTAALRDLEHEPITGEPPVLRCPRPLCGWWWRTGFGRIAARHRVRRSGIWNANPSQASRLCYVVHARCVDGGGERGLVGSGHRGSDGLVPRHCLARVPPTTAERRPLNRVHSLASTSDAVRCICQPRNLAVVGVDETTSTAR